MTNVSASLHAGGGVAPGATTTERPSSFGPGTVTGSRIREKTFGYEGVEIQAGPNRWYPTPLLLLV